MARSKSLPDVGQDDEDTKEDARRPATKDIRKWDNENVGETECNDVKPSEQGQLLLIEVELLCEEGEHRCKAEC